jgi:hypothetical protein
MLLYSTQNSASCGVTFKLLEKIFEREIFKIENVETPKKRWSRAGSSFCF